MCVCVCVCGSLCVAVFLCFFLGGGGGGLGGSPLFFNRKLSKLDLKRLNIMPEQSITSFYPCYNYILERFVLKEKALTK